MSIELSVWGKITVDGRLYDHDIVITDGVVTKRDKSVSKPLSVKYGHTPLTVGENIPWRGTELIVGTGHHGALPIDLGVYTEADLRGVTIRAMPTAEACEILSSIPVEARNAVLHTTC